MAKLRDEAHFKKLFKASVRLQKGYSLSLSAPVLPGLPDLYVVMPGYMPVLLEAKLIKNIERDTFKRKIEYSPMQLKYATEVNKVQSHAMMGLICIQHKSTEWCIMAQIVEGVEQRISHEMLPYLPKVSRRAEGFDVDYLFSQTSIPRLSNDLASEPIRIADPGLENGNEEGMAFSPQTTEGSADRSLGGSEE